MPKKWSWRGQFVLHVVRGPVYVTQAEHARAIRFSKARTQFMSLSHETVVAVQWLSVVAAIGRPGK